MNLDRLVQEMMDIDLLLQGFAAATNHLLTFPSEQESVRAALSALGTALNVDRSYIFENHPHPETGEIVLSQRWEWVAEGINPEIDNPELQNIPLAETIPSWEKILTQGQTIAGPVKNLPEQEQAFLFRQGIQSILLVPIFIDQHFWGLVGFDDCHTERVWKNSIQAALQAIAGTIGSAIARRRAEANVILLADRLKEAQHMAHIGSWELDLQQNKLYWSEEVFRIFEVDSQQFAASYEAFLDLVHPEDRLLVDEAYEKHLNDHQPYNLVHRLQMSDGRIKYVQEHSETIYSPRGTPLISKGTVQDITSQREAEIRRDQAELALRQELEFRVAERTAELEAREVRYRALMEGASDAILLATPEGNICESNPKAEEILGYSKEQLVGMHMSQLHTQESLAKAVEGFLALATQETCQVFDVEFLRADGEKIPVDVSGSAIKIGDETIIQGIFRDLRGRKQAEQAIKSQNDFRQLILENLTEGLCVCHAVTDYPFVNFTVWNPQMEVITGYTQAEINQLGWYQTLYPDRTMQARALARMRAMRQGEHIRSEEWTIQHRDGSHRIISIVTSLLETSEGETNVLAVMQDVTDRKRAEMELSSRNTLLSAITQAQAQFINADNRLRIFEGLLNSLLELTDSEYGFIGEVLFREDGTAQMEENFLKIRGVFYLQTHSITNIAWNEETQKIYDENYEGGMKFTNLKTLFGVVILTGKPLIANDAPNEPRRGGVPPGHPPLNSFLGMPFFKGEELIGMVGIANRPGGYTEEIIRQLEAFLTTCGNLVEGYRLDRSRKEAEKTIRQQAERETTLREITQRIRQSLDLQTIFDTTCQEVFTCLKVDRVGIFKFYPHSGYDDGEFVAEARGEKYPSALAIRVHDHCFGENYANLYAKGRYYVVDDIYHNGLEVCHTDILAQFEVKANMVMPLLCGDNLWGLLCIHQCDRPRHWQDHEISLGQQLASQLAIAIQQALLYEQLQEELRERQQAEATIIKQLRRQTALEVILGEIRQSLDLPEILKIATQQVQELLHGDRVIVFQLCHDGHSHIVEEAVVPNLPSLKAMKWEDETWSQEILERYWQGQPRIVPDVMNDIWTECLVEYSQAGQIQSKIVAPILQESQDTEFHRWVSPNDNNKLWGVLVVHACRSRRVWYPEEAQLLQQVANQLAIAIKQSQLFEQLQTELGKRQKAQQKLTQRNQELIRVTRLKDEFLANMSHELRTPLNAVLGMTEGLKDGIFGPVNDRQINALNTIERSGTHLLDLINDILDVAKIEADQMQLHLSPTDIISLCQNSISLIRQQTINKKQHLIVNLPYNLPPVIFDERRILQVLVNLLNNAVKFTPEGGQITLEVVPPEPKGNLEKQYIKFVVSDTGIGISPTDMQKLFQPFVQIDSALNRQYQGTGLGLILAKRIVELHQGQISLTSEEGVGSSFTVQLPYLVTDAPPPGQIILREQLIAPVPASAPPFSSQDFPLLLLAEDNEANIKTVSSYLKVKGYRIAMAKNGLEAVHQAQALRPDLILMDIQMPELDGLDAIKRIRAIPDLASIPIIAVTALAMEGDRQRCLGAGANGYVTKPIKLKELAVTIAKILA
nr:GAF domain-containing protein [Synechocystis sp. CACIAM 05]